MGGDGKTLAILEKEVNKSTTLAENNAYTGIHQPLIENGSTRKGTNFLCLRESSERIGAQRGDLEKR